MSDDGKYIAGRDDSFFSDHPDAAIQRKYDDYGRPTRFADTRPYDPEPVSSGSGMPSVGGGFGAFLIGLLVVVSIVFDKLLPWVASWWTGWHTAVAVIIIALFVGWKLLRAIVWTMRHPFKAAFRIAVLGLLVWRFQKTVVPLFQRPARATAVQPQPTKVKTTRPVKPKKPQSVKAEQKASFTELTRP
jgi:hypothetical protein